MKQDRILRLNSLMREVISEVIRKDVRNPHVTELLTITRVDVTRDLHYAKVYVSIIGSAEEKRKTMDALQSAADFIAVNASKKMVIRYFPSLTFKLDDSVEKHMRIEEVLKQEKLKEEAWKASKEKESPNDGDAP